MSLPPYLMGQQGYGAINWQPAQQGVENILARLMKRDQMQQDAALQQQRMGMEQERLGFDRQRMEQEARLAPLRLNMEQQRLDAAREDAQFNRLHRPMQLDLERQRLAATQDELGFKRSMHPLELEQRRAEIDLKRKALEANKRGTVKEGEAMWVEDPTAPGGIRFIDPPQGATKLNPTQAKELQEADDFILQTQGALDQLKRARQLNVQSYDGWLASQRADAYANLSNPEPTDPVAREKRQRAANTLLLENVVTNQALQSLRSIFGGNPTEGERKILLSVAGSVNQPRDVREQIFAEAQRLAEQRLAVNRQKAAGIRQGTYYKPGGQPDALAPRVDSAPGIPVPPERTAAPPSPAPAPLPRQQRVPPPIPQAAIDDLARNPSPQMKKFFEDHFNLPEGEADAYLKGRR